jgi:hypothetical protein
MNFRATFEFNIAPDITSTDAILQEKGQSIIEELYEEITESEIPIDIIEYVRLNGTFKMTAILPFNQATGESIVNIAMENNVEVSDLFHALITEYNGALREDVRDHQGIVEKVTLTKFSYIIPTGGKRKSKRKRSRRNNSKRSNSRRFI